MTAERWATISPDGLYRYDLYRRWVDDPQQLVLWIMLNPSTADAHQDDPTIRRCARFSQSWGYGAMAVVNLYALRATDPQALLRSAHPEGPLNKWTIDHWLRRADFAVAAWGAFHDQLNRRRNGPGLSRLNVEHMASAAGIPLHCLGVTKHGAPRHPLYVRANQPPLGFSRLTSGAKTGTPPGQRPRPCT